MQYILQHKLLSLGVFIVLLGALWYGFAASSSPAPVLSTTNLANSTDTQDQELVSTLLQLQAISLDGTILSDPGFLSLQDFTTQITPEPVGRPNPFAPLPPGALATDTPQAQNPNLFAAPTNTTK
jgi:hypothetical protein